MPSLLILDEITNNLDGDMREHVLQVLRDYPGSMVVVSHDLFLEALQVDTEYCAADGRLVARAQ
ncbi:hypothetical protein [Legionella geestiana]|nr:hypothetical protein [Legionella geestiana]